MLRKKYKFKADCAANVQAFLRLDQSVLKGGSVVQDLLHSDVIVTLYSDFNIDRIRNQMMGVGGSETMIRTLVEFSI